MDPEQKKKEPSAELPSPVEASSSDVVLIHGTTADGKGLAVLRHRENRLEHGLVMPIEPGKPIVGEIVTLQPRSEFPLLCDVKVHYDPGLPKSTEVQESRRTKGPGQVATDVYRSNWERIFQPKAKSGGDLN
jgi:hypothetical protein